MEDEAAITTHPDSVPGRLGHLIKSLHQRTGRRVIVLIDEYDKPILEALDTPDIARANRDYLRGLYAVIKSSDAHIRFSFITGVSKFSKVSLFSGLNNLEEHHPGPALLNHLRLYRDRPRRGVRSGAGGSRP